MAHRSTLAELKILLERAEAAVPKDTLWRHYRDNKGERAYTIIGHAVEEHSETIVVLYQSDQGIIFSRPLTEFCEVLRGGTQQRFQKI
jgi:hypothetical protein